MGEVIRISFMCLIWALIMKIQVDYEMDQTATRYLKDSLELAVHDAALKLDINQISEGKLVFEQINSEAAFIDSIEENMNMDSHTDTVITGGLFNPKDNSFFKDQVKIVHIEFIDDNTFPLKAYPCTYGVSCGNAKYDVLETINGPSIVVVAETKSPRFFNSQDQIVRQAVVYEYQTF